MPHPFPHSDRSGVREVRPGKLAAGTVVAELDALLYAYERISSGRFRYAWVEALWVVALERFSEKAGGRTSLRGGDDFANCAYNTIENGNDGFGIESGGVNRDGPDYPDQWYLQPIQGERGGAMDPGEFGEWALDKAPAVRLRPTVAADGATIIPLFSAMNQHDGQCDRGTCAGSHVLTNAEWDRVRQMYADLEIMKRHLLTREA